MTGLGLVRLRDRHVASVAPVMDTITLILLLGTLLVELASLRALLRVTGVSLSASSLGAARGFRQPALFEPNLNQRHQWFHFLVPKESEQSAYVDKVDKAGIELLVGAQVPVLHPVAVVDVGVAAHHLAVNVADVGSEVGWEV